jgi:hypothetical protein
MRPLDMFIRSTGLPPHPWWYCSHLEKHADKDGRFDDAHFCEDCKLLNRNKTPLVRFGPIMGDPQRRIPVEEVNAMIQRVMVENSRKTGIPASATTEEIHRAAIKVNELAVFGMKVLEISLPVALQSGLYMELRTPIVPRHHQLRREAKSNSKETGSEKGAVSPSTDCSE